MLVWPPESRPFDAVLTVVFTNEEGRPGSADGDMLCRPESREGMLNSIPTQATLPPMPNPATFGQKIRELRKAKNLTQRELADKVATRLRAEDRRGFDFTYLSKIENDKTPAPSIPAIVQIARVLGGDEHELIALAGKVPPELGEALKESEAARTFFRSALDAELDEDDWKRLLNDLRSRTKARETHPEPGD